MGAMRTLVVDTQEGAPELEAAGFTPAQARGLAKYVTGLLGRSVGAQQDMCNRLATLGTEVATKTAARQVEVAEHKSEITTQEVKVGPIQMGTELRGEIREVRKDMTTLSSRITDIESLIRSTFRMLLMWMVGTQIGAIVLGPRWARPGLGPRPVARRAKRWYPDSRKVGAGGMSLNPVRPEREQP